MLDAVLGLRRLGCGNADHPVVDVMITIFDNFRQKNWRFSQKPIL
jgi:hypothetical protein